MPTIERDFVFESIDENGNPTIDFPITRFGNIEDVPKAFPADGGNADTVDGKHAADFAAASHSHPASQISGLPASLPANGGNADTVDGKHAADFAAANHTHNYAAASHNHDTRYYTEAEVNNLLAGKSASSHNHDGRYYTEAEVNDLLAGKAASSHNHTAQQISGLPESLPANGGNADTVDGVHVVTSAALGLHRLASGVAAATTANCPAGAWYGQHS